MAKCPVCGTDNAPNGPPFRHTSPIFNGCVRAECIACGMVFAFPMPNKARLSEYNASYFVNAHGEPASSRTSIAFFSAIACLRVAFVQKYLMEHQISVQRVLEFGPGPGCFARVFQERFPGISYAAFETDQSCYNSLSRLGVVLVDGSSEISSDLVVMSHVLEHVPDPVEFVQRATQGLIPGGAIFIEVPCRDWEHKEIDEPHVLFFDKEPMRRLLAHLGFTDVHLCYYGQRLSVLKAQSIARARLMQMRSLLVSMGCVGPFAGIEAGMESLTNPLERAVIAPYKAHEESDEPAWWLRAVARKA